MIPVTAEELRIIAECRDLMARKGITTVVVALEMVLRLAQQSAGDDQSPTGTSLGEPSK